MDKSVDVLLERIMLGSDDYAYGFIVYYEEGTAKRLYNRVKEYRSFVEGSGSYSGAWNHKYEAQLAATEYVRKNINEMYQPDTIYLYKGLKEILGNESTSNAAK